MNYCFDKVINLMNFMSRLTSVTSELVKTLSMFWKFVFVFEMHILGG